MSHVKAPKRRRIRARVVVGVEGKVNSARGGGGERAGLPSEIPTDCENYVCSERDGHTRTTWIE